MADVNWLLFSIFFVLTPAFVGNGMFSRFEDLRCLQQNMFLVCDQSRSVTVVRLWDQLARV